MPADERLARLAAVRDGLRDAALDALLLTSLPNIRYVTGFSGSSALLLVTESDAVLVTDFRYDTQAREEAGDVARVLVDAQSLWAALWRLLPEIANVSVLGFESAHLLHRDFQRLLEAGGGSTWHWRPTADLVETLRARKSAAEIALIAEAASVAVAALERTVPQIRAGMTETQVAGVLEHALRDAGSEGYPFPTIVASGPRSALPHAHTSDRAVERGEFLLLDFGAVRRGYCADVTRTFVVGRADAHQREVYEIVRAANAQATSLVRAGMTGRDADGLARRYIEGRGWGEAFGHSLGHGLGLEVHEAPRLARTAEAVLPANAVVTIEPGVYRPGWGGVRIEDDVVLGDAAPRVLTEWTRELVELG
ncbi:MAG TPA: aminopeptidase P family protein [Gemmatimonadaceae bacterium]|nr:aminopeptidase P family protein [Gemmatimonadaceae bacterium]